MSAAMIINFRVEKNAPLITRQAVTLLMKGDNEANIIQVEMLDEGKPVLLDGYGAALYLRRMDGIIIRNPGTVSGNMVTVPLLESSYNMPGNYSAILRITGPQSEKRTILRMTGFIESDGEGTIIDPSGSIPSYDDLARITQELEEALKEAEDATSKANAAADTATSAAGNATTAAGAANSAASAVNKATVKQVNTLDNTQSATASVAVQDGAWSFTFGLPRGLTGPAGGTGNTVSMTADELESKSASELAALYTNGARWLQVTNNDTVVCLSLKSDGSTEFQSTNMSRLNILDNPNFSNPVNQRNLTQQKTSWQYAIDRWIASIPSGNTGGIYLSPGHISISTECGVVQPIGNKSLFVGKNFTLIARTISSTGNINAYVASGTYNGDDSVISFYNSTVYIRVYSVSDDENLYVGIYNENETYSVWVYNAQLIIGSYTIKTIPPFEVPDFTLETLKCQYYAQILSNNNVNSLDLRPTMRLANPTITQLDTGKYLYSCEL